MIIPDLVVPKTDPKATILEVRVVMDPGGGPEGAVQVLNSRFFAGFSSVYSAPGQPSIYLVVF